MDRETHARFLAYLTRYTYFGRGRERLTATRFAEIDAEVSALDPTDPTTRARRETLAGLLLRG